MCSCFFSPLLNLCTTIHLKNSLHADMTRDTQSAHTTTKANCLLYHHITFTGIAIWIHTNKKTNKHSNITACNKASKLTKWIYNELYNYIVHVFSWNRSRNAPPPPPNMPVAHQLKQEICSAKRKTHVHQKYLFILKSCCKVKQRPPRQTIGTCIRNNLCPYWRKWRHTSHGLSHWLVMHMPV